MSETIPTMRDPPDHQKAMVTEVHLLRGIIVGCYAHVEFLMGDICMKAWCLSPYTHLAAKFPYSLENRIKAASALFEAEGPLRQYSDEVTGLFHRLKVYEQYRHFLAHGLCIVTPTPDDPRAEFRLWRPTKQGAEIGEFVLGLEQMRENAEEIAAYCNHVIRLFHRVYLEQKLEIPDDALGPMKTD